MRISDWSSDVCSSDLHLAIDHDEGQPEQEPGRTPGEGLRELLPDVALPRAGLRLAVHPDADREENRRREQSAEAFTQFAARAAHVANISRGSPGGDAVQKSAYPAARDVAHHLLSLRPPKECHHRDAQTHHHKAPPPPEPHK